MASSLAHLSCALGLVMVVGCSGGGSGSQGDPADAALAARDCYMGLQVPGVTHTGYACSGTTTSSTVSGLKPSAFEAALTVSIALPEPPMLGTLSPTSMTLEIPKDGVTERWNLPVTACSVMATDSSTDPDFGWVYFRLDVSCSEPAVPQDANPGDPIDVGDFVIVTFFDQG